MPSDRARPTYDERQQYRAVVQQQGRVNLEADWNEGFHIVSEEQRKEALDFVGPVGTPDDGYAIGFAGASGLDFDFTVQPGTMYVGGLRVELPPRADGNITLYSNQPDWLNPDMPENPANEFIILALLEQEVSSAEDSALKDVALGGVDTTERRRLVQRVVRMASQADNCEAALAEAIAFWAGNGFAFDAETMQLEPVARLQVGFVDDGEPPDPCKPTAQGGYLGAENQLLRVQISAEDRFAWGFDNASFLYRITVDPDDDTLVHLLSRPVDEFHEPRVGQVVEILRPAFELSNGELVAESAGAFMALTQAYNPDGQSLVLPSPVSMAYSESDGTTQTYPYLFLRVWEEEVAFTTGTAEDLGATGVQVTLSASGDLYAPGTAWTFAVRPSTPVALYPQRYLDAPQPPEESRMWICPLAVIGWTGTDGEVLEDCRRHFDNLVELTERESGGCGCCITLGPEDVDGGAGLQAAIDDAITDAQGAPVTISLRPGNYRLREPLRMGPGYSRLTLEGCDHDVVITPLDDGMNFIDGLVSIVASEKITLRRLVFRPLFLRYFDHAEDMAGSDPETLINLVGAMGEDAESFNVFVDNLRVAVAVRAASCPTLRIEGCTFMMSLSENPARFQAGILLSGECPELSVLDNRFETLEDPGQIEEPLRHPPNSFGILHTSTVRVAGIGFGQEFGEVGGVVMLPALDHTVFTGNFFQGIGAAILVQTQTGQVRIENNVVRHCYSGIHWLSEGAFSAVILELDPDDWTGWVQRAAEDPLLGLGLFLARAWPLPTHFLSPPLVSSGGLFSVSLPFPGPAMLGRAALAIVVRVFMSLELPFWLQLSRQLTYSILVADNDVEVPLMSSHRDDLPATGHAYVLWDETQEDGILEVPRPATVTLDANRGVNRTHEESVPTGLVIFTGYCAITGGHLRNAGSGINRRGPSLVALPTFNFDNEEVIAVTGNTLHGLGPFLPPRFTVPPPINDWRVFNAVTSF